MQLCTLLERQNNLLAKCILLVILLNFDLWLKTLFIQQSKNMDVSPPHVTHSVV